MIPLGGDLSRYQGSRSDLLPRLPVCGVTRAPGLYRSLGLEGSTYRTRILPVVGRGKGGAPMCHLRGRVRAEPSTTATTTGRAEAAVRTSLGLHAALRLAIHVR